MKIKGSKAFGVPKGTFAISPSSQGYTLQYSADGVSFSDYSTPTPANETLVVTGFPEGMIYKCNGNEDDIYLKY